MQNDTIVQCSIIMCHKGSVDLFKKTSTSTRCTRSWKIVENTTKGLGKSWKTTGDVLYEPCYLLYSACWDYLGKLNVK